jgi:hypothetical protein
MDKENIIWQKKAIVSFKTNITNNAEVGMQGLTLDRQKQRKRQTIFILGKIDMNNIAETCKKYDHAARLITNTGYEPSVFTQMPQAAWMYNLKLEMQQRLKQMLMCDGIYLIYDWVDCSICIALHLLAVQANLKIINCI